MDDLLVERVLRAVEQVPRGRVVSYGDLAALVGTGPRQVGAVMARWGGNVPWWRVTDRSGRLRPDLLARAREQWAVEGIGLSADGRGCRIGTHRADLERLAEDHARATADLDDAAG
ncbi:MAG TPA: MGMT family protein [Ornithinimicrobium sp.]|nr:MGMT family protein [Ornithinimicrobium sp.]